MSASTWGPMPTLAGDPTDPANYGFGTGQFSSLNPFTSVSSAVPSVSNLRYHVLHPDNGMFWVGLFLAATVGLVGFNAHARVLNANVSGGVGKA